MVLAAAMLIGTVAMLVMGVEPILLGRLAAAGRLSDAGIGRAATAEIFCLATGATVGPFFMNAGWMRFKVGVTSVCLTLCDLAIFWADSSWTVILQRGAAGFFEGLLLGAVSIILIHTARPERMTGLLLGISTTPQAFAAYLLPVLIIPKIGVNAGFVMLAIAASLSLLSSPWVVDRVETTDISKRHSFKLTIATAIFIFAVLLQNAGIGAAWNYIERLASSHRFSDQVVGLAISASLMFQIAGAFLAAWLSWRINTRWALIFGCIAQACLLSTMVWSKSPYGFVVLASCFGLFWLALLPFQTTWIIELDSSRTIAVLMTPIALLGLSVGPFVASFTTTATSVIGAFYFAIAALVIGGLLYCLCGFVVDLGERMPGRHNDKI